MPEIPLKKVCVDCGEEKPLSVYYLDKNGRPPFKTFVKTREDW